MINMEELAVVTGDCQEMLKTILGMYVESHFQDFALMESYVSNNDPAALFSCSHTLKGTLETMCEQDAVPMLETVEQCSKQGKLPDAELMAQLTTSLQQINSQIESYLAA